LSRHPRTWTAAKRSGTNNDPEAKKRPAPLLTSNRVRKSPRLDLSQRKTPSAATTSAAATSSTVATPLTTAISSTVATSSTAATTPIIDSSKTASACLGSASQDSSGSGSSEKSLSGAELIQKVLKIVKNRDKAELMILELMEEYSFSFPHLKELLRGKSNPQAAM